MKLGEAGLRLGRGGYRPVSDEQIDRFAKIAQDATHEVRLSDLRSITKGVLQIDNRGFISGTSSDRPLPPSFSKGGPLRNPVQNIELEGQRRLNNDPINWADFHGMRVHSQTLADIYRMNFTISDGNGGMHHTKDGDTDAAQAKSFRKLEELAGSPEAACVLQVVLTQHELKSYVTYSTTDGESPIMFLPMGHDWGGVNVESEGRATEQVLAGQITNAYIHVEKTTRGDFKVSVDWDGAASGIKITNTEEKIFFDPGFSGYTAEKEKGEFGGSVNGMKVN